MEVQGTKTTRDIEQEYNITRQTIHNWIMEGLLEKPQKDFRNWFVWKKPDEENLYKIIKQKTEINNSQAAHNEEFLKISNRRYLGSKQKLLDFIQKIVSQYTNNVNVVADIFGGTGVVAGMFNSQGKKIIVNDILLSNFVSYNTWFGNESVDIVRIKSIINELNNLSTVEENYVSINFGNRYFSMDNARKIGAIREKIETYDLNQREKSFLLTSLLYAIDKVANTVGHYDAYRKKMDSFQPIILKVPEYKENHGNEIFSIDANQLVKRIKADLVYIDTPYNSRQYGDAYHLLENIVDWKKPEVEGIAKKMIDRSHIKSDYSTQKASKKFDDLIQNIDARYILISYNNMAQKGNGRSNAKISNEEIIESLKKRGKVEVFNTPFKVFTTGKTDIDDHKELLYLCTVLPKKISNDRFIQSAINYTGGKHKLLKQIIPYFPSRINNFYDVFAGGANLSINVNTSGEKIINDIDTNVINLYKYIQKNSFETMLKKVNKVIENYGLSDTKNNGYDYYNANSSNGLKDINKKQYERLRDDFNSGCFSKKEEPLIFYVLVVFSFNNQIRFNGSGKYNMPTGKRDFNSKMEAKLKNFKAAISNNKTIFLNKDFRDIIEGIKESDALVYLDPPYLISTASYNENGGWTEKDEEDLLKKLDELNDRNIKFALSNVLVHKGEENILLKSWSEKYNIHFLAFNYNNSNYQSKAKNGETIEVLITNY